MSISKTILIGTLGKTPVIGKTQKGKECANFSLATSKKWKDENGTKQEKTSWHNISCWGSLVKVCEYLDKGSKVYVEGEIEYNTYKNKDGVEVQGVNIVARLIDIISGKDKGGKSIDEHSKAKGNGFAPQSNHAEEIADDELDF